MAHPLVPALSVILLCQLAGETATRLLGLAVPGPVLGMALLLALLATQPRLREIVASVAEGILRHLSLFFVPAGVGIVTHLDQLGDKLREARVHSVVSVLLSGEEGRDLSKMRPDDLQYVEDLGLITTRPSVRISNRIYQEVLPRELTWSAQVMIANQEQSWYVTADHRLDMPRLLAAFQQFFREHSDIWSQGFDYREAAPQLLMQAFLQRIINGGGRISREYGLGRRRTDLLIEWPLDPEQGMYGPLQRVVIELNILRGALEKTLATGLEQTAGYTRQVGADEAHLVLFDRDPDTPWDEKIWQRSESIDGLDIRVWGA